LANEGSQVDSGTNSNALLEKAAPLVSRLRFCGAISLRTVAHLSLMLPLLRKRRSRRASCAI
jgi:hypothetical protein